MSKLAQFDEKKTSGHKLPENFLVKVDGYGQGLWYGKGNPVDAIEGTRLDTGEKVKVMLSNLKEGLQSGRSRPSIADMKTDAGEISNVLKVMKPEQRGQFMKANQNKTEPGGIVAVETAYRNDVVNGVAHFGARWISSLQKCAEFDDCLVLEKANLRVDPVRLNEDQNEVKSMTATVAYPDESVRVSSREELAAALTAALDRATEFGSQRAIVRMYDGSGEPGNQGRAFEVPRKGQMDAEKNVYVFEPNDKVVNEWVNSAVEDAIGPKVAAITADPDVIVEVVPAVTVPYGPHAKENYLGGSDGKRKGHGMAFRRLLDAYDEDGKQKSEQCFADGYASLRRVPTRDGHSHWFVTGAQAIKVNFSELRHSRELVTPHASPILAPPVEKVESAAPAPAPVPQEAEAPPPGPDFDENFTIDDVVGGEPNLEGARERMRA